MSFNSILLVFEDLVEVYVCCFLEPLNPIVFIVNDLELEHAISEYELDVLWVNTLDHECGFLDLNETICNLYSFALEND